MTRRERLEAKLDTTMQDRTPITLTPEQVTACAAVVVRLGWSWGSVYECRELLQVDVPLTGCWRDLHRLGLTGAVAQVSAVTAVGGYLDLRGYAHPLPAGLTTVGGGLDLRGYAHPLPAGLQIRADR